MRPFHPRTGARTNRADTPTPPRPSMDAVKIYSLLHVASGFLLTALTFAACAAPRPESRRRMMILTGVLSLLMLVGGFGLVARVYDNEWPHWVFVKIACWLGLSALAGLAYRRPGRGGTLMAVGALLVVVALVMVYVVRA